MTAAALTARSHRVRATGTLRTRITFWFAVSSTATLAVLFMVGYHVLQSHLQDMLDRSIESHFAEIKARLGDRTRDVDSQILEEKIRETAEYSTGLFFIEIEQPGTGTLFRSRNLDNRRLPDIVGKHLYTAQLEGAGAVRVREFLLPPFDVTIASPMAPIADSMRTYVKACLLLLGCMLAISVVVGLGLSRLVLGPLRHISEIADRIRSDNLSERIPVANVKDELSDLARLLNQMFDRLESAFNQVRRFSDEASHELKTPLSLVRLHAEKMLKDPELAPVHIESVLEQLEEVARLNTLVDELLFLSRAEAQAIALKLDVQDPSTFLVGFQQDAVALSEHFQCRFEAVHEGEGRSAFEQKWIRQVLLNILSNAIHVSPAGGLIALSSELKGGAWRVAIEDQGPGLLPAQREQMFERFARFNVPRTGDRGCGLGLAICRKVVEMHGGRIFATDRESGAGLRVGFELPAVE